VTHILALQQLAAHKTDDDLPWSSLSILICDIHTG
jgi:hypothetical protein